MEILNKNFQDSVEARKRRLDRLIQNFKEMYHGKIIEAFNWEIRFVVMSKFNKTLELTNTHEKQKLKPLENEEKIILIRPLAKYTNKGYLSLTGS